MQTHEQIIKKLTAAFSPQLLEVEDESHRHHVPAGAQSHFKVLLVSEAFSGKNPVRRHQMVYGVLADEMAGGVHALALQTLTGREWQTRANKVFVSPDCMGLKK